MLSPVNIVDKWEKTKKRPTEVDLYELGGKHVRYGRTPLSATIVPLLSVTRLLSCIWVD